jgi:hypothetical protein
VLALPGTTPHATDQSTNKNTTPNPLLLIGEQTIKKFGREKEPEDRVRIYLALWRLRPVKEVDLIMTLNEPVQSSASQPSSEEAKNSFLKAARTLQIHDWDLFAA